MDENKIIDRLDKLEEKIDLKFDKVIEDVNHIKIEQSEIKADVKYHIKRTDIAEENIQLVRKELEPIKKHVSMVNGALKLIGLVGVIATIVMAIVETIQFLSHYLHH